MTTKREPSDESILSARIIRAYPTLSSYSAASLAAELCAIERAQRRHAKRCCNGDYYGDYYQRTGSVALNIENGIAERKAGERIERKVTRWQNRLLDLVGVDMPVMDSQGSHNVRVWPCGQKPPSIVLQDDPRGPVLLLCLLGEDEAVGV